VFFGRPHLRAAGFLAHHQEVGVLRDAAGRLAAKAADKALGLLAAHGGQFPRDNDGLAGQRPARLGNSGGPQFHPLRAGPAYGAMVIPTGVLPTGCPHRE